MDRYEIFLQVVKFNNITKAATHMHYTQSGVSRAILSLEKDAGFPLFIRDKYGVTLTENGKKIVAPIQQIVKQQNNLKQIFSDLSHTVSGTIHIGSFTSVSTLWLPQVILAFQKQFPAVIFNIHDGNYEEIQHWIKKGEIDCGFLTTPCDSTLSFVPIKTDPLLLLLPNSHYLSSKQSITLEQIKDEKFILPELGCSRDLSQGLGNMFQTLKIDYVVKDDSSVISMVANGLGISILPSMILSVYPNQVVTKPFTPELSRVIGLASLKIDQVTFLTRTFIQFVCPYLKSF